MIVVADASPLRYLIQIEHAHVLRALYGVLIVPPIVITELSKPSTPPIVREWISHRPEWLQVQAPTGDLVAVDVRLDPTDLPAINACDGTPC